MKSPKTTGRAKLMLETDIFVSIDFDGTIAERDITDALIQRFAKPGWEEAERLWEEGAIGSRQCLMAQMSLIDAPMEELLAHVDTFRIDPSFVEFVSYLRSTGTPFSIISDGFQVFIERMLGNAGLSGIPVYANQLRRGEHGFEAHFPYAKKDCVSGTCKCAVADTVSEGAPVIHIGDGRSDFCIADEAVHVFSKGKLTRYCIENGIPHTDFKDFAAVKHSFAVLFERISGAPRRTHQIDANL